MGFLELAKKAALSGGNVAYSYFRKNVKVEKKKSLYGMDNFTKADVETEKKIKEIILSKFPTHQVVGEESGENGNSDYVWHIDPIDGTNNFIGGNVLVTVVNVFGNWFGDFIAPGGQQQQELAQEQPRGGTDTVPQNSHTNSQNNNNSNSTSSTLPTTTPLALLTSSPRPSFTPLILGTRIEKEPEESDKPEVLAYADTSTTNSNKKIRINLALLLPFVSGGVVILFVKKKIGGGIS